MKAIIATSYNYTPLRLESVTLYYEDGTRQIVKMDSLKKKEKPEGISLVRHFMTH